MTLFNNMLRDQRINLQQPLFSEDPEANLRKLKEQLNIYSFQFKAAANAFGKQRVSLNGKVGGMKDDICIALQLAVYYSNQPHLYVWVLSRLKIFSIKHCALPTSQKLAIGSSSPVES